MWVGEREKAIVKALERQNSLHDQTNPSASCSEVSFVADKPGFETLDDPSRIGFNDAQLEHVLMNDLSNNALNLKLSTKAWLTYVAKATKSIYVENYCFIPGIQLTKIFADYQAKKAPSMYYTTNSKGDMGDIDVLSNREISKYKGGNLHFMHYNRQSQIRDVWFTKINKDTKLVERPAADFKFIIHSKMFTYDGQTTVVSSYNMDPRSYHTNYETAAIIYNCPVIAKQATEELASTYNKAAKNNGAPAEEQGSLWEDIKNLGSILITDFQ